MIFSTKRCVQNEEERKETTIKKMLQDVRREEINSKVGNRLKTWRESFDDVTEDSIPSFSIIIF
jgi:hypothetical protein